jgi:hypothetical protein
VGLSRRVFWCCLTLALASVLCDSPVSAQQTPGTLRGRVVDQLDAAIVGATVILVGADSERTVITNGQGEYLIADIRPGTYTVRSTATGFAHYEKTGVGVIAGRPQTLDIQLLVTIDSQQVDIGSNKNNSLSTEAGSNAGAIVLSGSDLDILPDDPDDMAGALRAMAGPPVGPNGVQFTVDGFTNTGQPLPSRENIREVRINQNPFSAENDRLGFGLVQIFTRPGTDKLHGDASFSFSDESLNSRNPFAPKRAPFQSRLYGASVSGSLIPKKASFFVSFSEREFEENAITNATVLDPALQITSAHFTTLTPQRRTSINPRIDYQLNQNHTLVVRYSYFRSTTDRFGVGGFSLPDRAYDTKATIHTLQLTETAVLNKTTVNEFRLQYIPENRIDAGDNSRPTINVLQAFIGGAPAVGPSANPERRLWLQDTVTWIVRDHTFRAGGRLRRSSILDISPTNFGGTYTFGGGIGPLLNANDQPVLDAQGNFVLVPISSIERYRRTLVFQSKGLPAPTIRSLGGGATQFSLAGGNPAARAKQIDFGAFIQDDWRLRPSLTLSFGLRYDTQTNVNSTLNLGPRVAFAWSPSFQGNRSPKTVIRGGFGIFFDRFPEGLKIDANRYNGVNQQQFVTFAPAILDLFPQVPSIATLQASSQIPQTTIRIAPDLRLPYTLQSALSVERQLPFKTTITVNFVSTRMLHVLRSRNINAPVPGTFVPGQPATGIRPLGNVGNIFQFESSGRYNQNQLIVSVNSRLSPKVSFVANYTLNRARSDTDGVGTFPADSYDLSTEFGRSASDIRHFFFVGGAFEGPFGLRFNPLIVAFSGSPFNITTGLDTNNDLIFAERPYLATDLNKPGVFVTPFGAFDPNPAPGQKIIPRNFGNGPGFFNVFLTVSKAFKFGTVPAKAPPPQTGRATASGATGRSAPAEKRYSLTFSIRVQNLLNHANLGTPVGNLTSTFFGQSTATAGSFGFTNNVPSVGNRRIEGLVRFTF